MQPGAYFAAGSPTPSLHPSPQPSESSSSPAALEPGSGRAPLPAEAPAAAASAQAASRARAGCSCSSCASAVVTRAAAARPPARAMAAPGGSLEGFLADLRPVLQRAFCLHSFPSESVERHNKPVIEVAGEGSPLVLPPVTVSRSAQVSERAGGAVGQGRAQGAGWRLAWGAQGTQRRTASRWGRRGGRQAPGAARRASLVSPPRRRRRRWWSRA